MTDTHDFRKGVLDVLQTNPEGKGVERAISMMISKISELERELKALQSNVASLNRNTLGLTPVGKTHG